MGGWGEWGSGNDIYFSRVPRVPRVPRVSLEPRSPRVSDFRLPISTLLLPSEYTNQKVARKLVKSVKKCPTVSLLNNSYQPQYRAKL